VPVVREADRGRSVCLLSSCAAARSEFVNPRQRRGALLLIASVVGAVMVIGGVVSYASDVSSQLGPMTTVLRVTRDVAHLEPVPVDAVEVVEVPQRWAPETALANAGELAVLVAATDLPAGTVLQASSVTAPPEIAPSQREVAILVSPETGVGGKIRSGDVVDVYATYGGSGEQSSRAELVLQSVRIIDIAPAVERNDPDRGFTSDTAVPVTFALTSEEALVMAYAESFAAEVRLGLRSAADTERVEGDRRSFDGVALPPPPEPEPEPEAAPEAEPAGGAPPAPEGESP
jgi:pilus assembly protein CpaB